MLGTHLSRSVDGRDVAHLRWPGRRSTACLQGDHTRRALCCKALVVQKFELGASPFRSARLVTRTTEGSGWEVGKTGRARRTSTIQEPTMLDTTNTTSKTLTMTHPRRARHRGRQPRAPAAQPLSAARRCRRGAAAVSRVAPVRKAVQG